MTDTSDLAIQQIVTNGVPGTAMPVWGDRMIESDIQAIVGFIRQWETTAPEVAVPAKGGGGGPPWMRNNSQTTIQQPSTQGTQQPATVTQGQAQAQAQQIAWWQTFDWRILLLAFGGLSIAFTLIFMGIEPVRRKRPKRSNA